MVNGPTLDGRPGSSGRDGYATEVRAAHGLEAAQAILGHSRADVTQVYAERDLTLAARVAAAMG